MTCHILHKHCNWKICPIVQKLGQHLQSQIYMIYPGQFSCVCNMCNILWSLIEYLTVLKWTAWQNCNTMNIIHTLRLHFWNWIFIYQFLFSEEEKEYFPAELLRKWYWYIQGKIWVLFPSYMMEVENTYEVLLAW